jgi:hypothetical protein
MPVQNASYIKEKILSTIRTRGPTIPVHIAKEAGISMLFASAFLSELLSDRKIKMSYMRVGNSPIYFISGQEPQLETFANHLKSKEKDAFFLIQRKKILKDSEQSPPIRVALRAIKDFAIPFKKNGETFWRYMTASETESTSEIKPIEEHKYIEAKPKPFDKEERRLGEKIIKDIIIKEEEKEEIINLEKKKDIIDIKEEKAESAEEEYITLPLSEKIEEDKEVEEKEEPIEEKKKVIKIKEKEEKQKSKTKSTIPKSPKKKGVQKQDDKFFNKIKEFLSKETIEIVNIESFKKNEIILRIKSEGAEKLLVAYNKRKVSDTDIINANKKASQLNLKYVILSMGEPSKKLSSLIESAQNLEKIEKIEK